MSAIVLVVYDTKNGSTAEVAEAIAARLRERGAAVDVRPARGVRDLSGVDAVVVGAPIYSGRWMSGAHRVLTRVRKIAPGDRPLVAVFALGPRVDGPENWVGPREQFSRALAKHPAIAPVSTALFGGADPPRKSPRRDIRDWDAVQRWADELAESFGAH